MELVKQIKQAELQAKEIVEKAKRDAVEVQENAKQKRQEHQRQAQQERFKAIQQAVDRAEQQGQQEALKLTVAGKNQSDFLSNESRKHLDRIVGKVMAGL